jgi:hypothetical protein
VRRRVRAARVFISPKAAGRPICSQQTPLPQPRRGPWEVDALASEKVGLEIILQ